MAPALLAAIPAAAQTAIGIGNMLFSGRKKQEANLENIASNTPTYSGSTPISNYYNQAMQRYNTNPTSSAIYQRGMQDTNANTNNALSQLQDRRSGIAGIGAINQQANTANLNTEVQAENQQNQRFGELGSATQMKDSDDRFKFQTNTIDPFQLKLSLANMKAQAANSRYNAGVQNFSQGITNATSILGKDK